MASGRQRAPFATLPSWVLALFLIFPPSLRSQNSSNVASLIEIFKATNGIPADRIAAADDLGRIGPRSLSALSSLIDVLLDKAEKPDVRLASISALKRIATNEQTIVPGLIVLLKDKKETPLMRAAAFEAYLSLDPNLTAFTDVFARILADKEESPALRDYAANALGSTAKKTAANALKPDATLEELSRSMKAVEQIRQAFGESGLAVHPEATRASSALAAQEKSTLNSRLFGFSSWGRPWKWLFVLLCLPIICLGAWSLLLWRAPLRLWTINEALKVVPEFMLPGRAEIPIGLRSYLLISFFHYHPRVLDAWLNSQWEEIARRFDIAAAVAERALHLMLPAAVNGSVIDTPTIDDFRVLFKRERVCLRICGEGGSGKTSLACQIAKWGMAKEPGRRLAEHRMLPVLIQDEADFASQDQSLSLIQVIHTQTSRLLGPSSEISLELVKNLLKHQRILVLVDSRSRPTDLFGSIASSESGAPARINALIITATFKEEFSEPVTGEIEPLRIEADSISKFMGAYLREKGQRDLFDDGEFLEGCVHLALTAGDRNITPLLARLYLDHMIAAKELIRIDPLPENIPDLMLSWINELNRSVPWDERIENETVLRLAQLIAWESVKSAYRPATVNARDIAEGLEREFALAKYLPYLRDKLHLIQVADSNEERFWIVPDTLTEYLAAMHQVELLGSNEAAWRDFLAELLKKNPSIVPIKDFILAIRDCCLTKGIGTKTPAFVEVELGRLAGLDLTAIERARLDMRIKRLVRQLCLPNVEDRRAAAIGLGAIGPAAKAAIPTLVARLKIAHENESVRHAAILALDGIEADTDDVILVLIEGLKDHRNRLRPLATKSLIRIGDKAVASLVNILTNKSEAEEFRVTAAAALGGFENNSKEAILALIEVLRDQQETEKVRTSAADALGRIGFPATTAGPDLINLMQENKTLRRSAAKALIGIAPAARSCVLSLYEALNQGDSDDAEEVLATFRLSLINPMEPVPDTSAVEIRIAVEEMLSKIRTHRDVNLRTPDSLSTPAELRV